MGGSNGVVTEYKTYGDITIGFEADFDVRWASRDSNEVLIRRSRQLERFLQCEVAMPVPGNALGAIPQPPVITVCEKPRAGR